MNNKDLVSIITLTYNHENFIGECIESVLAQTYPHWEQIIIDDGSTDKTGEMVTQYKDKRIRYIRQNNVGIWRLDESLNKALQLSQGEFIAILSGDDFWPPYKLEKQITAFRKENVVLSWGKAAITDKNGKIIEIVPKSIKSFRNNSKEEILEKLLVQNFIAACTVILRKETLLSIGGFKQPENVPFNDYPTWLRFCLKGEFYPIDEIMGYYRQHEQQMTEKKIAAITEASKYSIDFLHEMPKELRDSIGVTINDLLIIYQKRIARDLYQAGKIAITEEKWKDARTNFKKAYKKGSIPTKIRVLKGLLCSYFKIKI